MISVPGDATALAASAMASVIASVVLTFAIRMRMFGVLVGSQWPALTAIAAPSTSWKGPLRSAMIA